MKKSLTVVVCIVAALALALSVGCSKKASGDPGEFMVSYTKDMLKIIKDNSGDCDKAIKELQAFADKNKSAIEEMKKSAEEMEKKMSEEEKKAYGEKMMQKLQPIMQESMGTIMEFSQKCPEQAQKLGEVMGNLK
jgi:ABC-type transporter MlaC component